MPDGMNYVAGRWEAGSGTFRADEPATGAALDREFQNATEAQVDAAARAAAACAEDFAQMAPARRAAFLRAVAEEIDARGAALTQAAKAETALPEARLETERGRTVNQLRLFADWIEEGSWLGVRIDHADPGRKPLPKPDLRLMNAAVGPVGVFGASNFPLAFSVAGGDSASAWAAGCPVVYKAHPGHPHTSEITAEAVAAAMERTGMPAGVFSMLHGAGIEVGGALVRHPLIKAVGFTGSLKGGRALFDIAAARPEPIPFYGELGSTNPVFLLPTVLAERPEETARQWVASVTMGCGQFCTNPGILVALAGDGIERFVTAAVEGLEGAPAMPMLNARIAAGYRGGVGRTAAEPGVEVLVPPGEDEGCLASPAFFRTTAAEWLGSEVMKEEMFGPAAILVVCDDEAQMAAVAQACPGQLTMTLQMEEADTPLARRLRPLLAGRAGRLLVNGYPTGVEVAHAMIHGGPYPSTTDARSTSVGTRAIERFVRPVSYQNMPPDLLPEALRDDNPLRLPRLVDGRWEIPSR